MTIRQHLQKIRRKVWKGHSKYYRWDVNPHVKFLEKAAKVTGDPRLKEAVTALIQHGLETPRPNKRIQELLDQQLEENNGQTNLEHTLCRSVRDLILDGYSLQEACEEVATYFDIKSSSLEEASKQVERTWQIFKHLHPDSDGNNIS